MSDITSERIRHGYTLKHIDHLAHASVATAWAQAMDYRDRYDAAWHAITELIYSTEERPTPYELKVAGVQAVNQVARDNDRHHGLDSRNPGTPAKAFERYWWTTAAATASREQRIVETLAVSQILPTLTPALRDAINALAAHGTYDSAADALGIAYGAFKVRVRTARQRVLGLWHEGETPVRMWTDRRVANRHQPPATHCGNGHEWTPENTRIRHRIGRNGRHETVRACRACARALKTAGAKS
jgi:DNA-directed RNA polymerase specialized sigma24 family protein